jgi:hydrogenase-4 component B
MPEGTIETLSALFITAVVLLATAGLSPLFFPRSKRLAIFSFSLGVLAGLTLAVFSLGALANGAPVKFELPAGLFPTEPPAFLIDTLSAFFCLILSILLTAISLYSVRYLDHYDGTPVGVLAGFFHLIVLSMLIVFSADNSYQFLIAWELMTLFAFFLVLYEYRKEQAVRAAGYYIGVSHFGALFLIVMFILLQKFSGTVLFSQTAAQLANFPRWSLNFIFIAALIGFGAKAGIFPLHVWLPLAHPVAPSNVSALMSGMLIKTGIYGLLRILLIVHGSAELWWGVLLLAIASSSALLGVMYALMEHDLKRLLAYHSIENIGIILIGVAMALIFGFFNMPVLAGFALTAGLFHTLNHAVFKALLFLGAGGVHSVTHTRDMEQLGGLARLMPWTAAAFLIGALSISAIPPLNGFVSEWMTFVSIIQVYRIEQVPQALRIIVPLAGAMLALTGALAAACFVKVFGIVFLGTPRSEKALHAKELPVSMRVAQWLLALICIVTGAFPFLVINATAGVRIAFFGPEALIPASAGFLSAPGGAGTISTLAVFGALFFFLTVGLLLTRAFGKGRTSEHITWACGGEAGGRHQYTATGFSKPIRRIFSALYQPKKQIVVDTGDNKYQIRSIKFHGMTQNIFERYLYHPLIDGVGRLSQKVLSRQEGNINGYLAYIFLLFILMLLVGGSR